MAKAKFEQRPNSGALWKNDKKKTEKHPDFTGNVDIEGTKYRLSAWKKAGPKGTFLSLAVSEWQEPTPENKREPEADGLGF